MWHPLVTITDPGGVSYFRPGMKIKRPEFDKQLENGKSKRGLAATEGRAFEPGLLAGSGQSGERDGDCVSTPPQTRDGQWLHESLWHSITVIFWGFVISSIIGVPLGIFAGPMTASPRLFEPFTEFVRYLPAPAFGALAVAILGIYDGPKIAIIVIGRCSSKF